MNEKTQIEKDELIRTMYEKMKWPYDYPTNNGLLKAIDKWNKKEIFTDFLFKMTIRCLIEKWGWNDKEAHKFCNSYYTSSLV